MTDTDTTTPETLEVTDQVNAEFNRILDQFRKEHPGPELEHSAVPPDDDTPGDGGGEPDRWLLIFHQNIGAPIAVHSCVEWGVDHGCCDAGIQHYQCTCESAGSAWTVFVPAATVKCLVVRRQP